MRVLGRIVASTGTVTRPMYKISQDALDYALTHLVNRGDTDIFPPAFELLAMDVARDQLLDWLAEEDLDTWATRQQRSCLTPKGVAGFRVATQLDPVDAMLITALVYEAGEDIERQRLGPDTVMSHRFAPTENGGLFDSAYSFEQFRFRSLELATEHEYVVITDISDFYYRLYLHPIENIMSVATDNDRARAIKKLLYGWNDSISHGIPVGGAAMRLIAELAIDDVDQSLRSEGVTFCRYSDDYRLFADSERTARQSLAHLADVLYRNHQLTLQEAKTEVLTAEEFTRRFHTGERDAVRHELMQGLDGLLEELGIDSYNEPVNLDELDDDQLAELERLNLNEVVRQQATSGKAVDYALLRFALSSLGQFGSFDIHPGELDGHLEVLAPVIPQLVLALAASTDEDDRVTVGEWLLSVREHAAIGHLPFNTSWLLHPFTLSASWNCMDRMSDVLSSASDDFVRTQATLALGQGGAAHWFKREKQNLGRYGAWERRAILAGASCLPGDESVHWYRSIKSRLDKLEGFVIEWARGGGLDQLGGRAGGH